MAACSEPRVKPSSEEEDLKDRSSKKVKTDGGQDGESERDVAMSDPVTENVVVGQEHGSGRDHAQPKPSYLEKAMHVHGKGGVLKSTDVKSPNDAVEKVVMEPVPEVNNRFDALGDPQNKKGNQGGTSKQSSGTKGDSLASEERERKKKFEQTCLEIMSRKLNDDWNRFKEGKHVEYFLGVLAVTNSNLEKEFLRQSQSRGRGCSRWDDSTSTNDGSDMHEVLQEDNVAEGLDGSHVENCA
ncbi:hypothetical protein RIF29_38054 [Crotalaria pallida]|uniref:Uncharacterized protein n=1 Tax=Crotalaria pallida TaxID=3830 RepID=A0AAN9E4W7_CROPI